jgi:2-oxoglutarate dehydrogenase E2 component (dihydrolipoamide succinyltransferase)
MPIELKIPVIGESITEVQINEWLKAEGDPVQKDESVAVIDSEKTTFDLPAPASGRLAKILHKAGETVQVGEIIAHLEAGAAEPVAGKIETPEAKAGREKPADKHAQESEPEPKAPPAGESRPKSSASPEPSSSDLGSERKPTEPGIAKPKAQEQQREIPPGDAKPRAEARPAPPRKTSAPRRSPPKPLPDREEEVIPMTMLRRTIARRLVESQQTMAMLTTFNEVDMEAVQKLRHQHQAAFQKRHGVKLGLMSFFVKAAIDALKQFPQLNAEVRDNDIIYRNYFDIGVAIATERGLVVPVLRRAECLSFAEVEKAISGFAGRAGENTLNPEELAGGTFTITNGGVFGSMLSTPIINPPQSGILGLHAIEDRPVARDGSVVIHPIMYVALTYDHRLVDGREAVLFLRRVKDAIESPVRMFVEV